MVDVGRKVIDGHRYYLLHKAVPKQEAVRSANWQRKGGFSARIIKVSRGKWQVWVRTD